MTDANKIFHLHDWFRYPWSYSLSDYIKAEHSTHLVNQDPPPLLPPSVATVHPMKTSLHWSPLSTLFSPLVKQLSWEHEEEKAVADEESCGEGRTILAKAAVELTSSSDDSRGGIGLIMAIRPACVNEDRPRGWQWWC
jgi:hypothetical protein